MVSLAKPYLALIVGLFLLALTGTTFVVGIRWGASNCEAARAKEHLADADALAKVQAANLLKDGQYEQQLRSMRQIHFRDQAAIDAAASRPVSRLVCHRLTPAGGAVSGVPAAPGQPAPGAGEPGDVPGSDFEPGPRLRTLAVNYARALESCYADLDTWPK